MNADKESLNYRMIYSISDIQDNKGLSNKEKRKMLKVISSNKYVSEIDNEKEKKSKKILSRIGLIAIGLAGILGISTVFNKKETKQLAASNKIPAIDVDDRDNELDNNKFSTNSKETTDFVDRYKVSTEDIEVASQNKTKTDIQKIEEEALKQFKLGDSIELGEGINYTEDSMGRGEKGETGVTPWRPAGQYEINGISILNSDNEIVTYVVDKPGVLVQEYIKNNKPEGGKVAFHITQLKDDEKNPTGWVEAETIYKAIVENYKQQNELEI